MKLLPLFTLKRQLFLGVALSLGLHLLPANAQQPAGQLLPDAATAPALQLMEIDDDNVDELRNLGLQARSDAVSLGASLEAVRGDNAAWLALAGWVRDGGVVFLHTDAAQLFGYATVAARPPTNQLGGQLFGRAVAAIPFGAHPLLWSGASVNPDLPAFDAGTRLLPQMGVQKIFYQLAPGDHLAVNHPAAVPLLRVVDIGPNRNPLYAAAIAPFGNGWAVFVPRLVEQNRADGAAFVQNLMRLAGSTSPATFDPPLGQPIPVPRPGAEPFIGLPAALIERAAQVAVGNTEYAALAEEWVQAIAPAPPAAFLDPQEIDQMDPAPRLMVTAGEASSLVALLNQVVQNQEAANEAAARFRALIFLLRARLDLQLANLQGAGSWIGAATDIAPDGAEVRVWQGLWSAASAQDVLLNSPSRSRLFSDAVKDWSVALDAPALRPAAANAARGETAEISGIPATAIQSWIAAAARTGELASVEPPLITPIGGPGRVVVIRHFPQDPTLKMALPVGDLLVRADDFLGWGVEAEEILIFPTDQYYTAYSQAARVGTRDVAFNPLAQRGNVLGNRIIMMSQITTPVLLDPGPPPRFGQLGSAVPAVIGRLHAQVLMNALTQDGTPAPAWMQLGLMSLSNIAVVRNLAMNQAPPEDLRESALAGGLLTPEQFRGVNIGNDRSGNIESQARRMILYFYNRFGAGAVTETLQRLGSGASVDAALVETTGLTEQQFFVAWRNAEFGGR